VGQDGRGGVSETPHPTDVEVSRALNAVVVTLNDARDPAARAGRIQSIVTGALGGEQRILVAIGADGDQVARLTDAEHRVLARVTRTGGRWLGERVGAPLSGGYVPSA
jgi:hypothetical protein